MTTTRALCRALGEAERKLPTDLQASPAQVEALLRGYLNTWAQYGLILSDAAFFDDTPSLRIDQYPVTAHSPRSNGGSAQRFCSAPCPHGGMDRLSC